MEPNEYKVSEDYIKSIDKVVKRSTAYNVFAFIVSLIVCIVAIFVCVKTNKNGLSSYELAIENGLISADMTEIEYLKSLYGKDGSNVTLEDVYKAYLKANNMTESDLDFTEFILTYYPDKIIDDEKALSKIENTTQNALRSTVDILYSFYMDSTIVYVNESNDGKYVLDTSADVYDKYVAINVAAGSGVIYQMDDSVAYIVTNFHVVYCENYTNSNEYRVFYNETKGEFFTAKFDESMWTNGTYKYTTSSFFGDKVEAIGNGVVATVSSIKGVAAPLNTHFLNSYGVYLYGYQAEKYELSATFVGGSADNDIAVLKIEKNAAANNEILFNGSYKAANIGDNSKVNEGETVVAVGNPLIANINNSNKPSGVAEYVANIKNAYVDALCLTSTSGEISNVSEYSAFESIIRHGEAVDMRLIRVSAAINAGNSGGGLYTTDGRLVGIVNGKIESESYDNVGYAIPINVASRLADQIISQCSGATVQCSAVTSSKLGIELEKTEISNSHYDSNSLMWVIDNDVVVKSVSGAAGSAGLASGDIIKAIKIDNGEYKILNFNYDLDNLLLLAKMNSNSVTFKVIRVAEENKEYEIKIDLVSNYFEMIV